MIRKSYFHATDAGQIVNPIPQQAIYLSDVISRVKKYDEYINPKIGVTELEDSYLKGYEAGLKEGFKQGISWIKGV